MVDCSFSPSQSHLKKYHGEEYLFKCGLCNRRYKTEKTMTEHMEVKHGTSDVKFDIEIPMECIP